MDATVIGIYNVCAPKALTEGPAGTEDDDAEDVEIVDDGKPD